MVVPERHVRLHLLHPAVVVRERQAEVVRRALVRQLRVLVGRRHRGHGRAGDFRARRLCVTSMTEELEAG